MLAAIAAIASLAIALVPTDESEAETFGSPDVGAKLIEFDANGGYGGYGQYVLSGDRFYFPTERETPGDLNSDYDRIAHDGFVLAGWSTQNDATSPQFYPGSLSDAVTVKEKYYAVWTPLEYDCQNVGTTMKLAQSLLAPIGTDVALDTDGEDIGDLMEAMIFLTMNHSKSKFVLEATRNGQTQSGSIVIEGLGGNENSQVAGAGGFSFQIRKGVPHIWGTAHFVPGITEVKLTHFDYNGRTGTFSEDWTAKWFVSTYDESKDPSNLVWVQQPGTDGVHLHGPYGTAARLPGKVESQDLQKGWCLEVNNRPEYPLGGSLTLTVSASLTPTFYSAQDILDYAGVIAYDAMGGRYNGSIAGLVDPKGYVALKGFDAVSKDGYRLAGWNPTGSPSDVVYPFGYLYDAQGQYTELKAVWVQSDSIRDVSFSDPSGNPSTTYTEVSGLAYAVPIHGFDKTGYTLKGWSSTKHGLGEGDAEVTRSAVASGNKTWFAVYETDIPTLTITYRTNGASGVPFSKVYEGSPAILEGCPWERPGYNFLGWSARDHDASPQYAAGQQYAFTSSGETTLHAVWTIAQQTEHNAFGIYFVTLGADSGGISPLTATSEGGSYIFTVPSTAPYRTGYDFMGWTIDERGQVAMPEYAPGSDVTLTVAEGESSAMLTLYAVWSAKGGEDGTFTIIYKRGSRTVFEQTGVMPGEKAQYKDMSLSAGQGEAFIGWYTEAGRPWDFDQPVTGSLVLVSRFVQVFSLDTGDGWIQVRMNTTLPYSDLSILYPDGSSESAASKHEVPAGSSGTVRVSANYAQIGTLSASWTYHAPVPEDGGEDGGDDTMLYVAGAAVALVAIFMVARWYL